MTYTFYEESLKNCILGIYRNGVLQQEKYDYTINKKCLIITINNYYFNDLITIKILDPCCKIRDTHKVYRT